MTGAVNACSRPAARRYYPVSKNPDRTPAGPHIQLSHCLRTSFLLDRLRRTGEFHSTHSLADIPQSCNARALHQDSQGSCQGPHASRPRPQTCQGHTFRTGWGLSAHRHNSGPTGTWHTHASRRPG
eukprot:2361638-Rhodomonas_salina.2